MQYKGGTTMRKENIFRIINEGNKRKILAQAPINEKTLKENGIVYNKCSGCNAETSIFAYEMEGDFDECFNGYYVIWRCPECRKKELIFLYWSGKKIEDALTSVLK